MEHKIVVTIEPILKERGISIRELSRMIDYHFESVRRFCVNESKRIPADMLAKICVALEIEVCEIIKLDTVNHSDV